MQFNPFHENHHKAFDALTIIMYISERERPDAIAREHVRKNMSLKKTSSTYSRLKSFFNKSDFEGLPR